MMRIPGIVSRGSVRCSGGDLYLELHHRSGRAPILKGLTTHRRGRDLFLLADDQLTEKIVPVTGVALWPRLLADIWSRSTLLLAERRAGRIVGVYDIAIELLDREPAEEADPPSILDAKRFLSPAPATFMEARDERACGTEERGALSRRYAGS